MGPKARRIFRARFAMLELASPTSMESWVPRYSTGNLEMAAMRMAGKPYLWNAPHCRHPANTKAACER